MYVFAGLLKVCTLRLHQGANIIYAVLYELHSFLQPVGALNPTRLDKILDRYENFDDPVIPQFHYGSHYSSAGTVR